MRLSQHLSMNVSEHCGNQGDALREGRRDEGKGGREGGIQRILWNDLFPAQDFEVRETGVCGPENHNIKGVWRFNLRAALPLAPWPRKPSFARWSLSHRALSARRVSLVISRRGIDDEEDGMWD